MEQQVIEQLHKFGKIMENEAMSNYTKMRVGGVARIILVPESIEQLADALQYLQAQGIAHKMIGKGSNILVSDRNYDGVIILLQHTLEAIEIDEAKAQIVVESGFSLVKLSQIAARHNMAGLAFASGIPGSVGGAVFMNAGAHGSDTAAILTGVDYLDECGTLHHLDNEACQFSYRTSIFQQHREWTIVRAYYQLEHGDKAEILAQMQEWKGRRVKTQPYAKPSCGSVFRNPLPQHAGQLIESLGLKGTRIGGAEVSPMHANFIINTGSASADDIMDLINLVKKQVKDAYGVDLHTEVELFNWE
ncbi:UDP-N-acetylmuramate dehydrogenase [Culicoidibacter larvae]|uniref:UDP-N-acetylenolpyruvoylglucosamine reductase n=1 Tax=Culicoidibacter larvae TaxID=2579976 RepID=A0A5R8Q8V1_9FIRM|nr:UDP-N-acetylmuramate dehydrogenase [Culicoidibacter larvae]TLG72144.1 UDP-N-acetylmuramate dehydrogenase [Culicoidibacter larvae]